MIKGTAYYFDLKEKRLVPLRRKNEDTGRLMFRLGVNSAEKEIHDYVVEHLSQTAFIKGKRVRPYLYTHFDIERYTLYISNFDGEMFKISDKEFLSVPNGTDGVLFLSTIKGTPIRRKKLEPHVDYVKKYLIDPVSFAETETLSKAQQQLLLGMKLRNFFFRDLSNTKPLGAWVGGEGTSKTTNVRKTGIVYFGPGFQVTPLPKEESDLIIVSGDNYYLALDNVDTSHKWLNDLLAVISTGGLFKKRKLYSDDDVVQVEPQCIIDLTSRTPRFRRADVADRTIVFHTEKPGKYLGETEIYKDLIVNRDKIASFILLQAQETIQALKATKNEGRLAPSDIRLADFSDFCMRVALHKGFEDEMVGILQNMKTAQAEFALEEDALVELLLIWADSNPDTEVTANQLFTALKQLSEDEGTSFPYHSAQSLAGRLRNIRQKLEDYLDVKTRPGHAGILYYTFSPKPEDTGG